MIDEILKDLILDVLPEGDWPVDIIDMQRAKTAIYEIGLKVIGREIDNYTGTDMEDWQKGYNAAKSEFRLAWVKACGVVE